MFNFNALLPTAVLFDPVVFFYIASEPTAVLLSAVFSFKALLPTAVLSIPVIFVDNEL